LDKIREATVPSLFCDQHIRVLTSKNSEWDVEGIRSSSSIIAEVRECEQHDTEGYSITTIDIQAREPGIFEILVSH
jgi:hypothetical protein